MPASRAEGRRKAGIGRVPGVSASDDSRRDAMRRDGCAPRRAGDRFGARLGPRPVGEAK